MPDNEVVTPTFSGNFSTSSLGKYHEQKKAGRPKLGNEARTERLTVYLTPTLYKQVKILANLDDVTIPNFIFGVLQKTVDASQEDISEQMQLQEKRKSRQA